MGADRTESGDPALLISRYVAGSRSFPRCSALSAPASSASIVPGIGTIRTPVVRWLFSAIFGYVMTCVTVLVLGVIINFAAPFFGGRRDFDSAFKLAVYSFTPVWLAGIFLLLPGSALSVADWDFTAPIFSGSACRA